MAALWIIGGIFLFLILFFPVGDSQANAPGIVLWRKIKGIFKITQNQAEKKDAD
ncbi:hypothetical protein [Neptuniibacter sp. QD37_11]|uniref:hypothetical protein n=1 Tax=Neptuniibacter sp. QD37_11 TaxID=3398209 RepID=UPI0039F48C49